MFTNLLKKLRQLVTQETEKTVLLRHALENWDTVDVEEGDTILFDKGLAGYGVYGQRQEALVLDYTEDDVQVTYMIKTKDMINPTKKTRWVPIYSLTSNLGTDHKSPEELVAMGLIEPKPQRAPNKPLLSGTYIEETEGGYNETEYSLVEIEKVNGTYYIHNVGDANCHQIDQDHEYNLHEFSSPEEGKYILDPGLYIRSNELLYEVIPFQGKCWLRRLDDSTLNELTENVALQLTRVETDEPTQGILLFTDEEPTYDEHLQPYKVPEPTGLLNENGQVDLNIPYTTTTENNPTDPI